MEESKLKEATEANKELQAEGKTRHWKVWKRWQQFSCEIGTVNFPEEEEDQT